jgi:hypothetical protein
MEMVSFLRVGSFLPLRALNFTKGARLGMVLKSISEMDVMAGKQKKHRTLMYT